MLKGLLVRLLALDSAEALELVERGPFVELRGKRVEVLTLVAPRFGGLQSAKIPENAT